VALAVVLVLAFASEGGVAAASAPAVQSTLSFYLFCSTSMSFAAPASASSCGGGTYSGVYSGISETVGQNRTSRIYLAGATGGVKVTFNLTDATTGSLIFKGAAYGTLAGGTCSAPSAIKPTSFQTSSVTIGSGDRLALSLGIVFTGTGTPTLCSGGTSATLLSIGTTVVTGTSQAVLTTALTVGTPYQTTLQGFSGVAVIYTDTGNAPLTAFLYGVVENSAGATVGVVTTSVATSPGVGATAFLALPQGLPSGTYTVDVVAVTSTDIPVSIAQVATVTV
jgi:hypothetical protein